MKTEINILTISQILFKDKNQWDSVDDESKEQFFFIFNRYFSKRLPHLSQLLNDKLINKAEAFDLWYYYFKDKSYPQWFWSKTEKQSSKDSENELLTELFNQIGVSEQEFDFLVKNYPQQIEEEINYLKETKKWKQSKKTGTQ